MLLENHPLRWALVLKLGAGSRKKRTSELCRNPGARAAGGWPHFCLDLGLHHTLFQGSDGSTFSEMCLHPSPAGVKMQLPRMDPRQPVVLEQEPLVAPDSSEPPCPWEAPTHESLLTTPGHGCLASAGRQGLPKQGCSGLAAKQPRGSYRAGSTTARPNLCPNP